MIAQEFAYAKSQGWLSAFDAAGRQYSFSPALLMAIASRETNMRNIVGDRGHGYGLMQVDVGTDPEFCHSGAWKNAPLSIHTGAGILASKRTQIQHLEGSAIHIGGQSFVGKQIIALDDVDRLTIAAYNCGLWAYYSFSVGTDIDRFTTGHNYSKDVLGRMAQFEELLK
jgi:soluble lytic murein transglycosylase-like protein